MTIKSLIEAATIALAVAGPASAEQSDRSAYFGDVDFYLTCSRSELEPVHDTMCLFYVTGVVDGIALNNPKCFRSGSAEEIARPILIMMREKTLAETRVTGKIPFKDAPTVIAEILKELHRC